MNSHEIERIACAMNRLRPDWPEAQLRTLLREKLNDRPRRDVCVALAWIACESNSATPYRVVESGPWWKAAAADDTSTHHHVAKVYGMTDGGPREICAECSLHRSECQRRSATNGHAFVARTDVKGHKEAALPRRAGAREDRPMTTPPPDPPRDLEESK